MFDLATIPSTELTTLHGAGQAANKYAQAGAFDDYLSRKAPNTALAQRNDLAVFCAFLGAVHAGAEIPVDAVRLQREPEAWRGVTWGLVEAFIKWQLQQGHAVASVNRRLSTVKMYCKLATKAGVLDAQELALIRTVSGYGGQEAKRINQQRETTRVGNKKAAHVALTVEQAKALKNQPDTPQGRRDALLMCLLLDHGLRCGEAALLEVNDFNPKEGTLNFYRPKVDKEQTHKLTADTLRALRAWLDSGEVPALGPVLRGSRKGGELTGAGMSERAITKRVRYLGEQIGIEGLSAHDCRHFWATFWAGKVDLFRLQEAGGWNSLAMPRRYTEDAQIANEGMA